MKKIRLKFFLIGITSFFATLCFSQSWEKSFPDNFGESKGFDVIETSDGSYVMVGDIDLPTGAIRHHIRAIKTDQDGNELWSRIYGYYNVSYRNARAIAETATGDMLVAGFDGFSKASVLKISADGDSLWTRFYGGNGINYFRDIIKTDDGDFIVVGQFEAEANSNQREVWAMGINANGDSLWSTTYFDPFLFDTPAMDISALPLNHYLISGKSAGKGFALEINASLGEEIWSKTYELSSDDIILAGAMYNNGDNLLLGGTSSGFAGYYPSLIQTDLSGEMVNNIQLPSMNFGAVSDLLPTDDSGFILTGSSYDYWNQSTSDIGFISKLDSNLEADWEIIFEDSLNIQGAAIKQTTDGGYIMAGTKQGNMFLKKIGGVPNAVNGLTKDNFSAVLFPNPVSDHLYISVPEASFTKNLLIRFYDTLGHLVVESNLESNLEVINMEGFSKGLYQYVIYKKDKKMISGKIAIQ
jgi:type IX secretion system substrate protein